MRGFLFINYHSSVPSFQHIYAFTSFMALRLDYIPIFKRATLIYQINHGEHVRASMVVHAQPLEARKFVYNALGLLGYWERDAMHYRDVARLSEGDSEIKCTDCVTRRNFMVKGVNIIALLLVSDCTQLGFNGGFLTYTTDLKCMISCISHCLALKTSGCV